jgi:hypothetical protein
MEPDAPTGRRRSTGGGALPLGLALILAGLVASCPLGLLAAQRGLVRPPSFTLAIGPMELAAPCPPPISCDSSVPYYALWHGTRHPDGSINYRLLYFTYLPPR